jgi:hypothetical protein
VVYEEMNATAEVLMSYWQHLRGSEPDADVRRAMPTRSPALMAQNALVYGGRQFGVFCLFMAQRFSARVTQGNADIRENFSIKFLARYSASTVKMLCPDVKPFPKRPERVGRWVAVMGMEAVVFQAPLVTEEEAREYARGGKPNPSHPLTSTHYPRMTYRADGSSGQEELFGQDPTPALDGSDVLVGEVLENIDRRKLSDIAPELKDLGITLDVLRNEVKRDPQFPKQVGGSSNRGYEYDFAAVQMWARRRHARIRAERDTT